MGDLVRSESGPAETKMNYFSKSHTKDAYIEIKSLGSQVEADELSVFLVPTRNQGAVSDSGPAAKFEFRESRLGTMTANGPASIGTTTSTPRMWAGYGSTRESRLSHRPKSCIAGAATTPCIQASRSCGGPNP